MNFRRIIRQSAAVLVTLTVMLLCSCGKEKTPKALFDDFSEKYGSLPSGVLYTGDAEEWEDGYMDFEDAESLYIRSDGTSEMNHVKEYAIYLGSSGKELCEAGIFLCGSHSEAKQVSKMCLRRLDMLSKIRASSGNEAISLKNLEGAFVRIYGKYVVYFVMPDSESAMRCIDRVM